MKLKMCDIQESYRLVWPDGCRDFTTDSPAVSVLTDFRVTVPLVIQSDTPAYDLEDVMKKTYQRFRLVVDSGDRFIGLVALEDLQHPDFLARIAAVYTREPLTVSEVMRPRHALHALDHADLKKAKVIDIIESLKNSDHHHCLVVDRAAEEIRGLISATDIAKRLRSGTRFTDAPCFAQLHRLINP
jgi:CBS domain containing-hemolysin-like protein